MLETKIPSLKKVRLESVSWAEETKALLAACRLMIAHFGTRREVDSWQAAVSVPARYIDVVVGNLGATGKKRSPHGALAPFRCSKATASMIAPILRIVAGPLPTFVRTIRTSIPRPVQNDLIRPFAAFYGYFVQYICEPQWERQPDLAPKEWRALNRQT
jgi:hypothetical protein